jgi:F-type H+-transporting ATPase subunit gamma
MLIVGERLASAMPSDANFLAIEGAESSLDAVPVIDRILATLPLPHASDDGLVVCLHDEHEVQLRRLLPLPAISGSRGLPPLTNEPPSLVVAGVAEHFLFHALLAALLRSIRFENRRRLLQMNNALNHIEQNREDLTHQHNRLRQEEIVEEIEIMIGPGHLPNLRV